MKVFYPGLCALILLGGCVTRQPDHFYVLEAQPAGARAASSQFSRQITLRVTVPSLVDRNEMIVTTMSGVAVMDHERWAAPLADLVTTALSQDIERRRNDVIVLPKSADHAGLPLIRITVEIDQLNARLGQPLSIETHWRVTDGGSGRETLGRDTFVSPQPPQNYAEVAGALSAVVALLADRLTREIPAA
jgi:uncharacterized protein